MNSNPIILECQKCKDKITGDLHGTYITCKCEAIAIDQTKYCCRVIGDKKHWKEIK